MKFDVISSLREKLQVLAVSMYPAFIKSIESPSKAVQLMAFSEDPFLLLEFQSINEDVQLKLLQGNPKLISLIDSPCETAQLLAVKSDPLLISEIKNPTEKVQLEVIEANPGFITLLDSPCEAAQQISVAHDSFALSLIDATENVCLSAVKREPQSIKYIKYPSDEVIKVAVEKDPSLIPYIIEQHEEKLPEDVKRSIMQHNPEETSKDAEFKSAIEKEDFAKLNAMKREGYIPSDKMIQSLSNSVPHNLIIAVKRIFDIKPTSMLLPEVEPMQNVLSEKEIRSLNANNVALSL